MPHQVKTIARITVLIGVVFATALAFAQSGPSCEDTLAVVRAQAANAEQIAANLFGRVKALEAENAKLKEKK